MYEMRSCGIVPSGCHIGTITLPQMGASMMKVYRSEPCTEPTSGTKKLLPGKKHKQHLPSHRVLIQI
eukprot:6165771-Amphidinium_carterae.1